MQRELCALHHITRLLTLLYLARSTVPPEAPIAAPFSSARTYPAAGRVVVQRGIERDEHALGSVLRSLYAYHLVCEVRERRRSVRAEVGRGGRVEGDAEGQGKGA